MKHIPKNSPWLQKQHGYSIVEWMIVITLSLFLIAGLLSVFVFSKRATSDALSRGERQENAAFAMQLLTRDLKQAYFFALATGDNKSLWNLNGNPLLATSLDCLDNNNSGSFPNAGNYRQLWVATVPNVTANVKMDCLKDADSATSLLPASDFISIKRVRGLAQSADFQEDRYYLDIKPASITVYLGNASLLTSGAVVPVWQYIHHVYYLDKDADIPRLRRLHLEKEQMVREDVLVEGIEKMKFMFALDNLISSERNGSINAFVGASQVTDSDWDSGRVIGIKIYLLARSLELTPGYVNHDRYQLGNETFTAPGDGYQRELLSHVVTFQNSVVSVND